MSPSNKRLILRSKPPLTLQLSKKEVVLIGGRYDGHRVMVGPDEERLHYGRHMYVKIFIEDKYGHKVNFFRSVNLTDIQAINLAISEYKLP